MTDFSKAKQRIVSLNVEEISLVDNPANEEEFLVCKRQEVSDMDNISNPEVHEPTIEEVTKTQDEEVKEVEKVEEVKEIEKVEEVSEKVEKAEPEVEEIEKALNPVQALALVKKLFAQVASALGYPKPKMANEKLEKALNPVQALALLKQMYGMMAKAMGYPKAEYPPAEEKKKSEDQEVSKGRKVFTSSRVERLINGLKPILDIVKEVDPEIFKTLWGSDDMSQSGIVEKEEPKEVVTKAEPEEEIEKEAKEEPVKKDEPKEEEKPNLEEMVTKALEPLAKRLESLEQIRGVSKSQSDQKTEDIKKQDNLWTGVV